MYLYSKSDDIDFKTMVHQKSSKQVCEEIGKLTVDGISLQELNARARTIDTTCPSFPVNGSVSRVNPLFEELILGSEHDIYSSSFESVFPSILEQHLSQSIDEKLSQLDIATLISQANEFDNTGGESHTLVQGSRKVRKENQLQKRRIAKIENYTCQVCGFRCEYIKPNGKPGWVINVDHILEKNKGGMEQIHNLWVLCPNCHEMKTRGVLKIDIKNKTVSMQDKVIKLHCDNHLFV